MYRHVRIIFLMMMSLCVSARALIPDYDSTFVPPHVATAHSICYWFDDDTTAFAYLPLSNGPMQLEVGHLGYGLHTVHIQLLDSNGYRYPACADNIFIFVPKPIREAALIGYWLDDNVEAMTIVPFTQAPIEVSAAGLGAGLHTLHFQLYGGDGSPYSPCIERFYINQPNNIVPTQLRYWFDDDSVAVHYQPLGDTTGSMEIDVSELPSGIHHIHYQLADDSGFGTGAVSDLIKIPSEPHAIDSVTYWVDDTANTHRTVAYAERLLLDLDPQECGAHTLYLQEGVSSIVNPFVYSSGEFYWMDSTCCQPPLFVTEEVGVDTARIHWSYYRQDNFNLILSEVPFSPDTVGDYLTVADTQYTFTSLTEYSRYYYAVRAACDSTGTWVSGAFLTYPANRPRLYVSTSGSDSHGGASWADALANLYHALERADSIRSHYGVAPQIWVAEGTYMGDGNRDHDAFTMVEGCNVYGGFAGTEPADFDVAARDLANHPTALDGQRLQRVVNQPVAFSRMTTWDGLEIRNCRTNVDGAAVYLRGNVTLNRCQIVNDSTTSNYVLSARSSTSNKPIYITNSVISNCAAYYLVGLENAVVENCLIHSNRPRYYVLNTYSSVHMANTSVVKNVSINAYNVFSNSGQTTLNNCIVWGNSCSNLASTNGFTINNSAVDYNFTGTSNNMIVLASENQGSDSNANYVAFASPADSDFHLTIGSACLDAGSQGLMLSDMDLEGNARPWGNGCDMGPYELHYFIECADPTHLAADLHTDYSVTLSWMGSPRASYIVAYRGSLDSSWNTVQQSDTALTLSGLPRDLYQWSVTSICEAGDTSDVVLGPQFDTYFHPEFDTVTLDDYWDFADLVPADNGIVCTNDSRFEWDSLTNALQYDLYIWQTDTSEPATPTIAGLTQPFAESVALPNYQPGEQYQWKIVARNRHTTRTSPTFAFETSLIPTLSVTQVTENSAQLNIGNRDGRIAHIVLDTVPIDETVIRSGISIGGSTYVLRGLDMRTTYYVMVKVDCGDTQLATNMVQFTTREVGYDTIVAELCQGEHYRLGNRDYYQSGTYSYRVNLSDSYDSLYVLNLTVHPAYNTTETVYLYEGETYTFDGREVSALGLTSDTMQTVYGCDSIRSVRIYRRNTIVSRENGRVCQGNPFTGTHFTITEAQTRDTIGLMVFADTIRSIGGFDSLIYSLNLTVVAPHLNSITGLMPAMDSMITDGALILRWDRQEDATKYRLYLWQLGNSRPLTPTVETTNNRYTFSNYENHTAYYWVVEALNDCDTVISSVTDFVINKAPRLTVSTRSIDFGEAEYDSVVSSRFNVSGEFLFDSIRLEVVGDDADAFSVSPINYNAMRGGGLNVTFHPQSIQHEYHATLRVATDTIVRDVSLTGRLSNYYRITLNIMDSIYTSKDTVPITGHVEDVAGVPQAGVSMDVYIMVLGQTMIQNAVTNSEGDFSVTYRPVLTESGYYQVGACLHDDNSRDVTFGDEFNIPGISFVDAYTTWNVDRGDTVEGVIRIRNRCNLELNNLVVTPVTLPNGLNVEFEPLSLSRLGIGDLHYRLVGTQVTQGTDWEYATFTLGCDMGYLTNLTAYYFCQLPIPDLQISYDSIICSTLRNSQKNIDLALYNNTDSVFHNVGVTLPSSAGYIGFMDEFEPFDLAPHDSAFVHLLIQFGADAALTRHSGGILVTADNTEDQVVPYEITVVSTARGGLNVTVTNEYTHAYGTNVAGANVKVIGYYSKDTVANVMTDSTGIVGVDSLLEGAYELIVSAPHNSTVSEIVSVADGVTSYRTVDLEYRAISYTWNVYQKDVEDSWGVRMDVEYETNVPKAVVHIEAPNDIEFPYDGSATTINLLVTNYGLIDAYDVNLTMPESDVYEFIPLYDHIDTLRALSSRVVPCSARNKALARFIDSLRANPYVIADTVFDEHRTVNRIPIFKDTTIYVPHDSIFYDSVWRYDIVDTEWVHVLRWVSDTVIHVDTLVRFIDTTVYDTIYTIDYKLVPYLMSCEEFPFTVSARFKCNNEGRWVFDRYVVRPKTCEYESLDEVVERVLEVSSSDGGGFGGAGGGGPWGHCGGKSSYAYETKVKVTEWECEPCWHSIVRNALSCGVGLATAGSGNMLVRGGSALWNGYSILQTERTDEKVLGALGMVFAPFGCVGNALNAIRTCTQGFEVELPVFGVRLEPEVHMTVLERNLRIAEEYYDTIREIRNRIVVDSIPIPIYGWILDSVIDHIARTWDTLSYREVIGYYESVITQVDTTVIHRYVDRWNLFLKYLEMGITSPDEVPEGFSTDFFYLDTATINSLLNANLRAYNQGFGSVEEMAWDVLDSLNALSGKQSLCVGVSLQFQQDVAMTREAFEGVLSIMNSSDTSDISDLSLRFTVTDSMGRDCSDRFDIAVIDRDYPDADRIGAGATGNTTVRFVPLLTAAPQDSAKYKFGGSISYRDPRSGLPMEDELTPVSLMVAPSPQLHLDYFVQKDIIADDPLTQPKVERSIPATIGLLVNNEGFGRAKNVRLSGLAPTIVDNRLGLVVDFRMLKTIRDGWERNLPLRDVCLGNVDPGQTSVLEYLFESTLLGTFTIDTIQVIHNSSIDDKDLSLVTASAHTLIHPVMEYGVGVDNVHDFLVDDIPDSYGYPDSLYFSSGAATSVAVADIGSFDRYVTPNDTVIVISMLPHDAGWNYTEMEDPGDGKYEIVSCVRVEENTNVNIPLDNIWLTFVDLPEASDPVYVNRLHLVDTLSDSREYHYNVTFRLREETLAVDTIVNIPTSVTNHPVDYFVVKFSKPIIDTTFSYADMRLKCNNGAELMDSNVVLVKIDDSTYRVNLAGKAFRTGLYVLDILTDSIRDTKGYYGADGRRVMWTQFITDTIQDSVIICEGEEYVFGDISYTQAGNYEIEYFDTSSQWEVYLNLTLVTTPKEQITFHSNNGMEDTVTQRICHQGTLRSNTFVNRNATFLGWSLIEGGDVRYLDGDTISLAEDINLYAVWSAVPYVTDTTNLSVCDSVIWNNRVITNSGVYCDTILGSYEDYDSIHVLNVVVNHTVHVTEDVVVCDAFVFGDVTFTADTSFVSFVGTTADGCDSVVTLNLVINSTQFAVESQTACDQYSWRGRTLDLSGTYYDTVAQATYDGCDSVYTINLALNSSTSHYDTLTVCDSLLWHDNVYTSSTDSPVFVAQNAVGCDSVEHLSLTVNYSDSVTGQQEACDSYFWHDSTYYSSTEASYMTQNLYGCDRHEVLQLTINHSTSSIDDLTVCDSCVWHGIVYTESTCTPTFTATNIVGCDSMVTLNLTVNHASEPTEYEYVGCDSLVWGHETFYETTNTQYVFTNSVGCDSIVSLQVTINYAAYAYLQDSAEGSYEWNGHVYAESGIYEYHTITETGCDSVVTLMLIVSNTTDIDLMEGNGDVTIYPNPTTGILNVVGEQIGNIEVYEATGRAVMRADNTEQIDISNLPSGIYFLRITHIHGVNVKRVMKR